MRMLVYAHMYEILEWTRIQIKLWKMQVTLNKKRDTYDVINEYKKRIDINNYT